MKTCCWAFNSQLLRPFHPISKDCEAHISDLGQALLILGLRIPSLVNFAVWMLRLTFLYLRCYLQHYNVLFLLAEFLQVLFAFLEVFQEHLLFSKILAPFIPIWFLLERRVFILLMCLVSGCYLFSIG